MNRSLRVGLTAVLAVLMLTIELPAPPFGRAPRAAATEGEATTAIVWVAGPGSQSTGWSELPKASGDGRYIAFESEASLGTGDTNGFWDIFVHDWEAVETIRVSMPTGGGQTNNESNSPAISEDGRYIVFISPATNLVSGDGNLVPDVFRYDQTTATTVRVSVDTGGGDSNGSSSETPPAISGDGRYVAFGSSATDLVSSDTNGQYDVFVRDMVSGTTEVVSFTAGGAQANGGSFYPSISADGTYVAFTSNASNLVSGDTNNKEDVFVRDREADTTERVSLTPSGGQISLGADVADISGDGSVVAFQSRGPMDGDSSTNSDVFVRDLGAGTTEWVSGPPSVGADALGDVSSNGAFVAFVSGQGLAYVTDLDSEAMEIASVSTEGATGNGGAPSLSADGKYVFFESTSTNLVQGDTNGKKDLFRRDRGASFSSIPLAQAVQCGEGPDGPGASCQADPVNSLTGAFVSHATDLTLPGIGMPFAFSRSYASNDSTNGPLGRGWTHSFEASLAFDWDGDAILRNEVGQVVRFSLQTDGSFEADPGNRSVLTTPGSDYLVKRRGQNSLRFNSSGKLIEIADRNGNDIDLAYSGGLLSTITDTAGREITFTHNLQDKLSGISAPDGRSVAFGYTGGLLTSVTDVRDGVADYEYDASSRLMRIIDQNDHAVVENTYGASGRVTSQEDALGYVSSFSWDKRLHTSTMTDARGKEWKDKYKNNLLVRQTDPLGNVTMFTHDEDANVTSVADPRNNTTTMTYGGRGNMLTRTAPAPLSYEETWTYNSNNDPLTYEDGRGNTTSFDYDASGDLIEISQPGGVDTQFGRNATTGQLTSTTDPRGKTTTFAYDSEGNLDEVSSPMGNETTFTQDSAGRFTSMVDPRGNAAGADPDDFKWLFSYDAAGNLLTRTDPLGHVTEWTYDPAGNVETVEDANGHTTTYGYTSRDQLETVTAPGSIETSYSYDQVGNLTTRTDDNLHETTYGYDDAGRLSSVTDPLGNTWTYGYDAAGNVSSVTDAEGNFTPAGGDGATSLSYDGLNRNTGVDYSSSTPDVTWAFDASSNPTQMTDGLGTETYAYDALNRLSPITRGSESFSYVFDDAGNVTKRTYPDGTVVDLAYDDEGRLSTVTSGSKTWTYGYDQAGNLTSVDYPNGSEETRTYDEAGRVTSVTHEKGTDVLASFDYTLDAVGNPTRVDSPSETITYEYDDLDRLTEACYQASCTLPVHPFIRYAYDGVGNRLTESRPTGTTTYVYDAADRLTATTGLLPIAFTYDRNGNQTAAGLRTFSWRQDSLLSSTTQGTQTTTYTYDGWGKRASATVGSDVTKFAWDVARPLPELALERDGSGGLKRRYLYGRDLLQMTTGGSDYTYHHDALGSVATVSSATGAKVSSYLYEPFGSERLVVPPNPATPDNRMGFTGEYLDPTGLYHLRARQYSTSTGQFLGRDRMFASAWEPYGSTFSYVKNRPTVGVDPSGLCFLWLPHNDDGSCWGHEIADGFRYVATSPFTAAAFVMGEISGTCQWDGSDLTVICVGDDPVPGGRPAMTIGSVILAEEDTLDAKTLEHEKNHVDQWAMGPLFPILYLANEGLSQLARGDSCMNEFEKWAGFESGGYRC